MTTPRAALWTQCLAAARQISAECKGLQERRVGEGDEKSDDTGCRPGVNLQGCGAPLVDLLGRQAVRILGLGQENAEDETKLFGRRLSDLIELAHARFYAYVPSDVPVCWRQLYTDASILQFALRWWRWQRQRQQQQNTSEGRLPLLSADLDTLDGLVRPLDMALILAGGAGPAERGRRWIHEALEQLHQVLKLENQEKEEGGGRGGKEEDMGGDDSPQFPKRKRRRVEDQPGTGSNHGAVGGHHHDWSACPTFADLHRQKPGPITLATNINASTLVFTPPIRHPVPRSGPLGLEAFQAYLDRSRSRHQGQRSDRLGAPVDAIGAGPQPLVMTGLTDHWPARQPEARPWSSPAYLRWRTLGGRRLVPVEVGRSYVDAGWTQAVVPFEEVLAGLESSERGRCCRGGGGEKDHGPMYLAQHALFAQMPRLRDDICIPDACYTSTTSASDDGYESSSSADGDADDNFPLINAWLGPPGTITPLHTDPHHNLLAQVVGRKYVRLYSPEQTAALRPRGREAGVDMGNTSTVDVGVMEGWDKTSEIGEDNPSEDADDKTWFQDISFVDCILEPGDTLYIPRGWWHYVRGLSVSFSVSFWWN